ncbi:hypothetical protein PRUPE_5G056700 [Prunus persica]|uniref:Peptidase C1A papain C-terminal domain-containing protein n=1 Tax=Prunus persica TaxID=3760 RepID=M5WS49_PRUPE|nr:hypothetical protein PRUPE_5G056700 [Prunus persica]
MRKRTAHNKFMSIKSQMLMSQNYFILSLNEFADLTNEEFREIRDGYMKQSSKSIMSNSTKATCQDHGCEGDLMDDGFQFIQRNKRLTTEVNHSHQGVDGTTVANEPISVAIDASGCTFQFYSSGVYTGTCGINLDHGAGLVVMGLNTGWGGILGARCGESGYVTMQRGIPSKEGLCGIAIEPSYPTA